MLTVKIRFNGSHEARSLYSSNFTFKKKTASQVKRDQQRVEVRKASDKPLESECGVKTRSQTEK